MFNAIQNLLDSEETIQQLSCTNTPQQNGVFGRKHRYLLEIVRSLLLSSSVLLCSWRGYHVATYLINCIPSIVIKSISPYKCLHEISLLYDLLHVCGCECFVVLPKYDHTKLSVRSLLCVFLGYGVQPKMNRCYHPETGHLFISRHVFLEKLPYY